MHKRLGFRLGTISVIGMLCQLGGLREANPLESNGMDDLQVEVVRFVEECQPNIVEARFSDSEGRCHTFVDKSAIFTTDWSLDSATKYPHPVSFAANSWHGGRCPLAQMLFA